MLLVHYLIYMKTIFAEAFSSFLGYMKTIFAEAFSSLPKLHEHNLCWSFQFIA